MSAADRQPGLRETVAAFLAERTPGEECGFDIGCALVPGPQGQLVAGYLLIVSCRSPVLVPPRMAHAQVIPDAWPDENTLAAALGMCLDQLAAHRRRLLEVPATAGINGHAAG